MPKSHEKPKANTAAMPQMGTQRTVGGAAMTNLIAIVEVCVVTNVTHWNNEERAPYGDTWLVGASQPGSVTKEMTEKTETTEVVEVKTLRFTWEGKEYSVLCERVLSRKVKRWKRKDNWEETP